MKFTDNTVNEKINLVTALINILIYSVRNSKKLILLHIKPFYLLSLTKSYIIFLTVISLNKDDENEAR